MKTKIGKLLNLLKQPSTHKGLIVLAGAVGYKLELSLLMAASAIAYSLYQIFRDEDKQIKDSK